MTHRDRVSLFFAIPILFGSGCTETTTPTEVPAYVAASPSPTPVPQPASMSGRVTKYSGPVAGMPVQCQGRSTTTASDGTYSLTGLMSGTSNVNVFYTAADDYHFTVSLAPGPNARDFFLYE